LLPSRRTEIINLLRHKPFLELLGTSEPDQQQALLETATAEQVHCLYEKKIFNAEVCNDETPTLQT
jgi:hypothetical protein